MTQPLTPASPTPHHGEPSSAHVTRHNPTVLTQCVAQQPVTLTSVADGLATAPRRTPVAWLLAFTADRVALARSSPELEQAKDVWDLRLWGGAGRLSFTGGGISNRAGGRPSRPITQP